MTTRTRSLQLQRGNDNTITFYTRSYQDNTIMLFNSAYLYLFLRICNKRAGIVGGTH